MKKNILIIVFLICFCLFNSWHSPVLALTPIAKQAYEKVETVQTRPGIEVDVLVIKPDIKPLGVLLVFPGQGTGEFSSLFGMVSLGPNFVVRTAPDYIKQGYAVAIVDAPSDKPIVYYGGVPFLDPQFRSSQKHVDDVRSIIDYLAQKHGFSSFYLLGTSLGTVSIIRLAIELNDPKVKGFIWTSGMGASANIKDSVILEKNKEGKLKIKAPVLIVHHANDRCQSTPFEGAIELKSHLANSSKVDLIKVFGESKYSGSMRSSTMFECGYYANHGFYGMEEPVTQAIGDWCAGKAVPAVIGHP
ncbi:MAG: hypothetical protein PHG14_16305 [Desulfobacter postgatei]|uniref:alpha/beta hydrolase n=1 Tax=Desulfobacter postgatei TaxID=2293 RepID=UPI0023F575D0|nr:hypothetical protein [Desulfobacter postgatei]MDD4275274.1 hypothetical protein [Desulfobacter postgatei]